MPLPATGHEWLMDRTAAGGEPAVMIAVREAASIGLPTTLVAVPGTVPVLRALVDAAGLQAVTVAPRVPGATVAEAAGAAVTVLVHDPLCPLTPGAFLAGTLAAADAPGDGGADSDHTPTAPTVAVRPMTDTVKVLREGYVHDTVDRTLLRIVASPVVVAPETASLLPEDGDVPALVTRLLALGDGRRRAVGIAGVRLVDAPSAARRVRDRGDLDVVLAMRDLDARLG